MAASIKILLTAKQYWDWVQDPRDDAAKAEAYANLPPERLESVEIGWDSGMGGVLLTVVPAAATPSPADTPSDAAGAPEGAGPGTPADAPPADARAPEEKP